MLKNDVKPMVYACVKKIMIFFLMMGFYFSKAQQQTLIGHQDFLGYYNPSLIKEGNYANLGVIHRTQWEGIGPISNTLYFRYPFRVAENALAPQAVGTFLQYEDFQFLTKANFQFFMSNHLATFQKGELNIGVNVGGSLTSFNFEEFDLDELIDPELSNADNNLVFTNRVGLSYEKGQYEVGVSSNVTDFQKYHVSFAFEVPLKNKNYRVKPLLIFRSFETSNTQIEAQARLIYRNKINFTAGYRQHYGTILQLGISLNNKIKGSYGSEIPARKNTIYGLTHEIFASLAFETSASKQHKLDSIYRIQRDSINKTRIDSLRLVRIQEVNDQEEEDELDLGGGRTPEKKEEGDKEATHLQPIEPEDAPHNEVILFEDIPNHIETNTHVVLNHIGFESGLYLLKPYAFDELDKLVVYLKHHKHLHIEIQGHTDNVGSVEINRELSRNRALTVFNYLSSQGIDVVRMNVVGYGEDLPLYPNDTEEHRKFNRRIEVVFTELGK